MVDDIEDTPEDVAVPSEQIALVHGHRGILELFDHVCSIPANQDAFAIAFQREINNAPMAVFKTYIMPMLKKSVPEEAEHTDGLEALAREVLGMQNSIPRVTTEVEVEDAD